VQHFNEVRPTVQITVLKSIFGSCLVHHWNV